MTHFEVEGGFELKGCITPQGAKNEALQVICAVLLTDEECIISNIPDILDIKKLIELLSKLGVKVREIDRNSYSFKADNIDLEYLKSKDFITVSAAFRGSIMIAGPLLARFGKAFFPKPGGDKIGRRKLDTHLIALQELGAEFVYDNALSYFSLEAPKGLKASNILLEEASVTGTANVLMAAVMADGKTTIFNAACEPYITQLASMLLNMGADIDGVGSNLLRIRGKKVLGGVTHKILPDMIEIGSFAALATITKSSITIKDVAFKHLGIIPKYFTKLGVKWELKGDDIIIHKQENYKVETHLDGSILTVADAPWPGLTPDLLSVFLVLAVQAEGSVLIHQKMFESRLFFIDKLVDMGAKIILCDPHRAVIIGNNQQSKLKATTMSSPDIRAGVSLLIAALSAQGTSIIKEIDQIDRGYQDIDKRLIALGARIRRVNS